MTLIMIVCLFNFGILAAFDCIRRKCFDLFMISHHISYCILIPGMLYCLLVCFVCSFVVVLVVAVGTAAIVLVLRPFVCLLCLCLLC